MNSQVLGLRVSGTIFGLMALGQLMRFVLGIEVLISGFSIPFWPSLAACAVLAGLCFWLWRVSFVLR